MTTKLVPPDGGWGWIVVGAYALNNISTIPIMQAFGLIFKNTIIKLGMSHADASIIMNTNSAFGMALGLINGPLLRIFGYRKISIAGALIYSIGVILTSWANSFVHFIITYGILTSLGMGLGMSSFSLAVNSYFKKKRGRAIGLAMTVTGLGPIIIPQVISFLISIYSDQGAVLILGAFSLHALVAALLLHPVKWHMIAIQVPEDIEKSTENIAKDGEKSITASLEDLEGYRRKRTVTMSSIDHDVDTGSIYGFETPLPRKISTSFAPNNLVNQPAYRRSISQYEGVPDLTETLESPVRQEPAHRWWSSGKSLDTVNLGSSVKIFDEKAYRSLSKDEVHTEIPSGDKSLKSTDTKAPMRQKSIEPLKEEEDEEEPESRSIFYRALRAVVLFFDLDLLRDPIYVNLMVGMSVAIFAELNFSLLTPFILHDMNFTTEQIATVLSVIAGFDLVFRGAAPYIGEWLNLPARTMYLISLFMLICSRTGLIFASSYVSVLLVAVGLGVAKGIRSIYMSLVLPNYVPIERLASASGIQMVVNGIFLMGAGPLVGVLRDKSGSYDICIGFLNCVTLLTCTMWIIEMIIVRRKNARLENTRT